MTMKKTVLIAVFTLILIVLSSCASGTPQADYDRVKQDLSLAQSQATAAQSQITTLQAQLTAATTDKDKLQAQVTQAQTQIIGLQDQMAKLKADNQLTGATPTETAQKIIKFYHDSHVYTSYDLFVCGDMAQEVWNMLKAQNINSRIEVGNIKNEINDIIASDHAWVLAEIAPNSYLALETTAGFSVPQSQNPLYYRGWSFASPKDYKDYANLLNEYNTRVVVTNDIVTRFNQAAKELEQANAAYNQMVAAFNTQYSGKPVGPDTLIAEQKLADQGFIVKEKTGRVNQMNDENARLQASLPPIRIKMQALVKPL